MGKRLPPVAWAEIGRRYVAGGATAKSLAREYGVSASSIYKRSAAGDWPAPDGRSQQSELLDLNNLVERLEQVASRFETGFSVECSRER
ncbi:transposase-like protein [Paraburkholderia bannensis]|uniref:Transposase-like protein n=1 Tax=Paraburkholderia bannensis TaxID=765414 RepID=A0A7W9TSG4_9BURK|nr:MULTISPECIES: hypothetical protein [Paraburkholderia]MBB3255452.1 transposase-like protein [Paraburkholderia sp. WP4_3_2]MBB6100537.1 transposase-like protein [Paraburkholderia bannensis]